MVVARKSNLEIYKSPIGKKERWLKETRCILAKERRCAHVNKHEPQAPKNFVPLPTRTRISSPKRTLEHINEFKKMYWKELCKTYLYSNDMLKKAR